jgi:hypothetical protein
MRLRRELIITTTTQQVIISTITRIKIREQTGNLTLPTESLPTAILMTRKMKKVLDAHENLLKDQLLA